LQHSLVELRKRERELTKQTQQQETTIASLKKQVKRSNQISRELIDKVKAKNDPIQRLTEQRD
jgi:septal ring factor EnvC (AmiA/AmiB activator)